MYTVRFDSDKNYEPINRIVPIGFYYIGTELNHVCIWNRTIQKSVDRFGSIFDFQSKYLSKHMIQQY